MQNFISNATIEWFESSGPVAPAFFYQTNLKILINQDKSIIQLDDEGYIKSGTPQRNIHISKELNTSELYSFIEKINSFNPQIFKDHLLSAETKRLIGISFNHIKITLNKTISCRWEYTLVDLKNKEFTEIANFITILKELIKITN